MSEQHLLDKLLDQLHQEKQRPNAHTRARGYWDMRAEERRPLIVTPAEQFLPEKASSLTNDRDIAFLKELELWDQYWQEGPSDAVLAAVNDALEGARAICTDSTSSDGFTLFGSAAAWAWQITGHEKPPPKPIRRQPPF